MAHELKEREFGEISELLEKERNLDIRSIRGIIDLFWEFHFLRKAGNGVEPFDPLRMETHARLSGIELSKWEYRLLMDMDLVYRAGMSKKWE